MNIDQYQELAISTAIYPKEYKIVYPTLGLAGEGGEVAEKVKKAIRDDGGFSEEKKQEIAKELGDVLWYVANIANDIGFSLDTICQMNVEKLQSRKERNKLQGSGDNR